MSWSEQNALKKVVSVFKRSKERNVPIYDNDIEAIKTLNKALEIKSKAYVNDNLLYAKLLCFVLYRNVEYLGGIKQAIKHIQTDVLNFSLDEHIEMLRRHLNQKDFDEYLSTLGLSETFTGEDEESNLAILTKNQNEVITKLNKFWNFDKVKKSFYNTANEFLQDTDNYI
jgi:hypothetical protein